MDSIVIEKWSTTSHDITQTIQLSSHVKHTGVRTSTKTVSRLPVGTKSAHRQEPLEDEMQRIKRVEKRPWKLERMCIPVEELAQRMQQQQQGVKSPIPSPSKGNPNGLREEERIVNPTIYEISDGKSSSGKAGDTLGNTSGSSSLGGEKSTSELWVDLSPEELEVFRLLNLARTQPQVFADSLQRQLRYLVGNTFWWPEKPALRCREGRAAIIEAIQFLRSQTPCEPFIGLSNGLCLASRDLGLDISKKGITGHIGTDDSNLMIRLGRYGQLSGKAYEDLLYGLGNAEDIVLQFIVDDNIPSRCHRTNLFRKDLNYVGLHLSSHISYQHVCVLLYATSFTELPLVQARQMERWLLTHLTTAPRGVACPGCNLAVAPWEGVFACGQRWHAKCCLCQACKSTVVTYVNQNNRPCCKQCWEQHSLGEGNGKKNVCLKCAQPISEKYGQVDEVIEQVYCMPCFTEELKRLKREHLEL